jgi:hypothetical protein
MLVTTFAHVVQHISNVTPEQIGKCHKIFGPDNRAFWAVENERGDCFEGQVIEYSVRYSPEHGYTCTCPAGAEGFAHVHHPSGVCKHCRWVAAAELEEQAALAEIQGEQEECHPDWYDPSNETSYATGTRAHLLLCGRRESDDATYTRVFLAQPKQPRKEDIQRDQACYRSKGFSLMK